MCLWKAIFASLSFVDRYQRFSKEWNQVARIRSVKAKTFKETADVLGTSPSTIIRPAFKDRPVIIADRFHYFRYIHWVVDEVRRKVQKEWHPYDRKKSGAHAICIT